VALTTRAEWQVDSRVRSKTGVPDDRLALDGAGERGKTTSSGEKTGVGGTRTGKVVVEGGGDGDDADSEGDGDGALDCPGTREGRTVGRPAVVP
jgi:hypothetical protein